MGQIGWACENFTGEADRGNGVGDDALSWSIDGYRKLRWHGGLSSKWPIGNWKIGDVVCCAVDIDNRAMRFALNGQWSNNGDDTAFSAFTFKDGSGIAPAVSFGNGQRLRMNLGAPGTPLKFTPPSPHYAAVWEAYGTPANVSKGTPFGRKLHWAESTAAGAESAPATRTGRPGESNESSTAVATICEILASEKVRSSISKALAQDSVSEALQAILIASVKAPDQLGVVITSQLAHITPVYLTLMSECPEILAAVPGLMALVVIVVGHARVGVSDVKEVDVGRNRLLPILADCGVVIADSEGNSASNSASSSASNSVSSTHKFIKKPHQRLALKVLPN